MWSFFFSSRRRHTRSLCDWSSDVCSSDLELGAEVSVFVEIADDLGADPPGRRILGGEPELRSEERRVGKEWRCRWSPDQENKRLNTEINLEQTMDGAGARITKVYQLTSSV